MSPETRIEPEIEWKIMKIFKHIAKVQSIVLFAWRKK